MTMFDARLTCNEFDKLKPSKLDVWKMFANKPARHLHNYR